MHIPLGFLIICNLWLRWELSSKSISIWRDTLPLLREIKHQEAYCRMISNALLFCKMLSSREMSGLLSWFSRWHDSHDICPFSSDGCFSFQVEWWNGLKKMFLFDSRTAVHSCSSYAANGLSICPTTWSLSGFWNAVCVLSQIFRLSITSICPLLLYTVCLSLDHSFSVASFSSVSLFLSVSYSIFQSLPLHFTFMCCTWGVN